MKLQRCSMIVAIALATGSAASAGAQSAVGRDIAANCANCHGTNGRSNGIVPALAGKDKATLVLQLKEFREGKRASTVMQQLAKGYSDAQIEAAASFFAAQKP